MDQMIALQYIEDDGRRRAGLTIQDWPNGYFGMQMDQKWKALRKSRTSGKGARRQKLQQYNSRLRM